MIEHEDREEQDLVFLTEVQMDDSLHSLPEAAFTSPSKSNASTKNESFDSEAGVEISHTSGTYPIGNNGRKAPVDMDDTIIEVRKIEDDAETLEELDYEKAERARLRKRNLIGWVSLLVLVIVAVIVTLSVVFATRTGKQEDSASSSDSIINQAPAGSPVTSSPVPTPLPTLAPTPQPTHEPSHNPTPEPTPEPPPMFTFTASRLFASPADYPTDPDSSPYKSVVFLAAEYLSSGVELAAPRLLQRYTMTNLYYSLGGQNWTSTFGFLSSEHECSWNAEVNGVILGAVCVRDGFQVDYIALGGNNLEGTIPDEIGSLPQIYFLDLSSNYIGGTIPESLASATQMEKLTLSVNQLTGTVPSFSVTSWPNLSYFAIERNLLEGNITDLCLSGAEMRADCIGEMGVSCDCCNFCCASGTQFCGIKP